MNMELSPACKSWELRESKKSGFMSNAMDDDDVMVEILIRLPDSKSAFRCKATCKRWNSVISSNYFMTRYTSHHGAPNLFTLIFKWKSSVRLSHVSGDSPHNNSVIQQCLPPVFAATTNPGCSHPGRPKAVPIRKKNKFVMSSRGRVSQLDLDFLVSPADPPPLVYHHDRVLVPLEENTSTHPLWIQAEASCDDLLLVSRLGTYYVVNPITKGWIVLPNAPLPPPGEQGDDPAVYAAGLLSQRGECSTGGRFRFKVIRIPIVPTPLDHDVRDDLKFPPPASPAAGTEGDELRDKFTVQIFCSESKQWTEHKVKWYPFWLTRYILHIPIISHNGMLHWVNGRSLVSLNPFDLAAHRAVEDDDNDISLSRTIDLPAGVEDIKALSSLLGLAVSQGHIRVIIEQYCFPPSIRPLSIWELEEEEEISCSRKAAGGGGGVWRLVHRVLVSKLHIHTPFFHLGFLAFHPYDGDIFFLSVDNYIYEFDLRSMHNCRVPSRRLRLPPPPPHNSGHEFRRSWLTTGLLPLVHGWFPTSLA